MVGGYGSWSKRLTYNTLGLLWQAQDARGITTTFAYDDLHRVQTVSYSDSTPQITYGTDQGQLNKGRLVKVETAAVTATNTPSTKQAYTYNLMGRVVNQVQQVGANTYALGYNYNDLGEAISETYPAGRTANNVYDHAGRLTYVGDSTRSYAQQISYEAFGGLKSEVWGNYQAQSVTYNNCNAPLD